MNCECIIHRLCTPTIGHTSRGLVGESSQGPPYRHTARALTPLRGDGVSDDVSVSRVSFLLLFYDHSIYRDILHPPPHHRHHHHDHHHVTSNIIVIIIIVIHLSRVTSLSSSSSSSSPPSSLPAQRSASVSK